MRPAGQLDRGLDRTLEWGAVASAAVLCTIVLFSVKLNTDAGWFLYLAERVRAGESLYVDRIEINLPWIVYLSRVPVGLARWIGASEIAVTRSLIFLATVGSVYVTARCVRGEARSSITAPVLAAWLLLVLLWIPGSDIGEREHLFVLAFVPYVALRSWKGAPTVRTAVVVGLAAGVTVALKPHFVPIWVAIEIDRRLAGYRWDRPESVSAGIVLGLSAALLPLLHPEYFDLIRDYWALYSDFRSTSPWRLLGTEALTVLVIAGATLGSLKDREFATWTRGFIVAALASLLVGIGQAKGFTYHLYPAHAFAAILLLLLAIRLPRLLARATGKRVLVPLVWTALSLYVLWGAELHRWSARGDAALFDSAVELLRQRADGGTVLVLSVRMPDVFPLINVAGVAWASRYNSMWPLVSLYAGEGEPGDAVLLRDTASMGESERRFFGDLVADLSRYEPGVVLVDTEYEPALGGRFDYLAYLAQDSLASREISRYAPGERLGRWRVYERDGQFFRTQTTAVESE